MADRTLKLGLIGDHIDRSRSPLLHRLAGGLAGIDVTYDRLVPQALGRDFDAVFADCARSGYRGINVTYPYKERVTGLVAIHDPVVRAMGAVNTVLFEPDGPVGLNTDRTGFEAAYRAARGATPPGVVAMIGTGGVGRAVAFGLAGLGAAGIRLVDRDPARAEALADALRRAGATSARVVARAEDAADGASGVVNCTPVGMDGHPGTPLDPAALPGRDWAFDAVYTPVETTFLTDARAAGVTVISGWELFFHQGLDAWHLFSGRPADATALRPALLDHA